MRGLNHDKQFIERLVLNMFQELNYRFNQTIVMITHNPEAAQIVFNAGWTDPTIVLAMGFKF